MRVVLAGYNVDCGVMDEAQQAGVPRERMTPEVLSAAYARISRDPRPASELRKVALEEVEKARNSNRKIIFGMGHHSVAEHAVFNFDLLGISRLAIEGIERFRLCSFTEKSQRYITLDHDFSLPAELAGTEYEQPLMGLVGEQAALYDTLCAALMERLNESYPKMREKRSGRRVLEGWAKEDARYVTLLCTTGQLGLTANARNLELMVRRLSASNLEELRALGKVLYEQAREIAPSLLLFTEPSLYDTNTEAELAALSVSYLGQDEATAGSPDAVRVVEYSKDADRRVATALLHLVSGRTYSHCKERVAQLSDKELRSVFETALGHMEFFDAAPREFEHVTITFELVMSSACFAQLKRHRMSSQSVQNYDPSLGVTIPPAVVEVGMRNPFLTHMEKAESLFSRIRRDHPHAAAYGLTNAHRRRVLCTMNLRDLYHFVRLREDQHAQWDIRELAAQMRRKAEEIMPLTSLLLSGKDSFVDRFEGVFDRRPQMDPAQVDPLA